MVSSPRYDIVIHNGTIITVNENFDIIPDGEVCVKDGKIKKIAPADAGRPQPEADTLIDVSGGIIMPGLVNTHTHAPMILFRGMVTTFMMFLFSTLFSLNW